MSRMRDDLILPAYSALETLRASSDQQALESARHTLATLAQYAWIACRNTQRDGSAYVAAVDALRALIERHERTGAWRCTGPELAALRAAVIAADVMIPLLRTHQVAAALIELDERLR